METMKELQKEMPVGKEAQASPEVSVQVQPLNQAGVETKPEVKEQVKPTDDLIQRVSQVKVEEKKPEADNPFGLTAEDFKKVTEDPSLSKYYKSMQSDYIKKTQQAAEVKRQAELKLQELSIWTPERVKQITNDPQFIQSAQKVLAEQNPSNSGMSDEKWSTLSTEEKQSLQVMQQELLQLKQQNIYQQFKQQDETLKTKYANYNPEAVDIITNDLLTGKVQATREDLWKVYDYEPAVRRAYELGRQDKLGVTQEKINSMSIEGISTRASKEVPKAEANESTTSYFGKLVLKNLAEQKAQR